MYNFSSYSEKYKSREETIIKAYDRLFNRTQVPNDYITMAAVQADGYGNLLPMSELKQLLDSKFLKPKQFHGVDIDKEVIGINEQTGIGNWYVSDIYNFLEENIGKLRPSIINMDTVHLGNRCADLVAKTLLLLTEYEIEDCMLVVNVMMSNPHNKVPISKINLHEQVDVLINGLSGDMSYSVAASNGWMMHDEMYYYSSTNTTIMGSFLFYRH